MKILTEKFGSIGMDGIVFRPKKKLKKKPIKESK